METITIAREEYEDLLQTAAKVELIEEVIHPPELSTEIKQRLAEARKVPDQELLTHEEIKRKYHLR